MRRSEQTVDPKNHFLCVVRPGIEVIAAPAGIIQRPNLLACPLRSLDWFHAADTMESVIPLEDDEVSPHILRWLEHIDEPEPPDADEKKAESIPWQR